jgi:hypothetical protein
MLLQKSERFLKEYKSFSERISKIENENLKTELTSLLGQLVNEVKTIDAQHEEIVLIKKMPDGVNDTKNVLMSIRKKIAAKLEEYEKRFK